MAPPAARGFTFRPLASADLPAAFELQRVSYIESLRDSLVAFSSRLEVGPDTCWVAEREGRIHGYILAHPWYPGLPPAVDTVIEVPPAVVRDAGAPGLAASLDSQEPIARVHYVHDLSVSPDAKGAGLGRELVAHSLRAAWHLGLRESELVAVPGAAVYWSRLGYTEVPVTAALAEKLRCYGAGAVYMRRAFGERGAD